MVDAIRMAVRGSSTRTAIFLEPAPLEVSRDARVEGAARRISALATVVKAQMAGAQLVNSLAATATKPCKEECLFVVMS